MRDSIPLHPLGRARPILGESGTAAAPRCRAGFVLFLVVNANLFIRPAEIVPGLLGLPIYEVLIAACLLTSLPVVLRQFRPESLKRQPAVLCVIGLVPAILLSNLVHGNVYDARMGAVTFLKVLVYFLLLTGLVNTPSRLKTFLCAVVVFILVMAALAVMQYHGAIDIEALAALDRLDRVDEATGEVETIKQLQ